MSRLPVRQPHMIRGPVPVHPKVPRLWKDLELVVRLDARPDPVLVTPEKVFYHAATGNPQPSGQNHMLYFTFDGDDAINGIPSADLRDSFPGNANVPFTFLTYLRITDFSVGVVHNIAQKDNATGTPYFLWVTDNQRANCAPGTGGTLTGNTLVQLNQWTLLGSRMDAAGNLDIIVNGRVDNSGTGFGLTVEATPLNLATRNDDIPAADRSLRGDAAVFYFWSRTLTENEILWIDRDPFLPLREAITVPILEAAAPPPAVSIPVLYHHLRYH